MGALSVGLRSRLPAALILRLREQLLVAAGQVGAGVGNLLFVLLAARLLDPGGFARLTAFLALYLVLHVPLSSLAAGGALDPGFARAAAPRIAALGVAVGVGLAAGAPFLADALGLATSDLLALAAAAPAAGLVALHRGRLYGLERHGRAVGSFLTDATVRLAAGGALLTVAGVAGGTAGVVLAGWAGLGVALAHRRPQPATGRGTLATPLAAIAAFLALAVVQNQGILLANRLFADAEAARFAAVATLGNAALFAVWHAPLVLLPRASRGDRHALVVALGVVGAVGAAGVLVVATAPELVVGLLFGGDYQGAAPLAAPYLTATTLLALGRVLAAHRCATGRTRSTAVWVAAAAAVQLIFVVAAARDAADVVAATLIATGGLAVAFGGVELLPAPGRRPRRRLRRGAARAAVRLREALTWPRVAVAAFTAAALLLRLAVPRGLWLDEALSVAQANLPLAEMLADLRQTDVHPPGHHVVLWAAVRALGDGELAVRVPSILAGTATVPLLYLTGRDLFSRHTGLVAAALGTVAPLTVWYAQEARMYSLYLLLALAAVWLQVRAVRDNRARYWVGYAVVTGLLLWTHYFAGLQVLVQQLAFAGVAWRRHREGRPAAGLLRGWVASAAMIAIILAPLMPFLLDQLDAYLGRRGPVAAQAPAGAGTAGTDLVGGITVYRVATNLVWAVLGYHPHATMTALVALWPLGMLFGLFLLGRGPWSGPTRLLLGVAVVPLVLLAGIGLAVQDNLFEIRYVIGTVPAVLLLVSRVVTTAARQRAAATLVTAALVAVLAAGLADQQVNSANPRLYDFRGALERVEDIWQPGDVLVHEPPYLDTVVAYYTSEVRAVPVEDLRGGPRQGVADLDHDRVIVLASFLDLEPHARETGRVLSELDEVRSLEHRLTHGQVQVWVFE